MNDLSILVDHKQGGNTFYRISVRGLALRIEQNREGKFLRRRIFFRIGFFFINTDRQNFKICVSLVIPLIECPQLRQFHPARTAPARPVAHHHRFFAAIIRQRNRVATQRRQRKLGRAPRNHQRSRSPLQNALLQPLDPPSNKNREQRQQLPRFQFDRRPPPLLRSSSARARSATRNRLHSSRTNLIDRHHDRSAPA